MNHTRVSCGLFQPGPNGLVNLDAVLNRAQGQLSSMASRSEAATGPHLVVCGQPGHLATWDQPCLHRLKQSEQLDALLGL